MSKSGDRRTNLWVKVSMITGLNHLTLSVTDLDRAIQFYTEVLSFSMRMRSPSSAYLEAGTLWLEHFK